MAAVIQPPRSVHRQPDQLRDLTVKYELLDRTDGSARFRFGETQALASVSGPIEVRLANENPSKATFDVIVRPLSSIPGTEAKSLAATIRSLLAPSLLLSQNPRTLIQLVIQSLSPTPPASKRLSPGLVAAMINASTVALLNAAIPMRGVVCAVSVAYLSSVSSSPLILDPTDDQIWSSTASGCFAFMFASGGASLNSISEVWSNWQSMTGFDERQLSEAKGLASAGAKQVWEKIKESLGSVVESERVPVDEAQMEI